MPDIWIADLYCGGGGATKGLQDAGFQVVGFDIHPQHNYIAEFELCDALEVDLSEFDAVWASPPCQAYTRKTSTWGRSRTHFSEHPDLIAPTRDKLISSKLPYIIENVVGAPLREDVRLCGTQLGLPIIKHRIFESNVPLQAPNVPCNHSDVYNPWSGVGRSAKRLREAMGIDWLPCSGGASRKAGYTGDLMNAIPPRYSWYLGRQLMEAIK